MRDTPKAIEDMEKGLNNMKECMFDQDGYETREHDKEMLDNYTNILTQLQAYKNLQQQIKELKEEAEKEVNDTYIECFKTQSKRSGKTIANNKYYLALGKREALNKLESGEN